MRNAVRVPTHLPAFLFGQRSRINRRRAPRYGTTSFTIAAALFIHILAGECYPVRKLLLRDTSRKLAHVEKQLGTCQSISEELSERPTEHSL